METVTAPQMDGQPIGSTDATAVQWIALPGKAEGTSPQGLSSGQGRWTKDLRAAIIYVGTPKDWKPDGKAHSQQF